jgi:hypothetical protein
MELRIKHSSLKNQLFIHITFQKSRPSVSLSIIHIFLIVEGNIVFEPTNFLILKN